MPKPVARYVGQSCGAVCSKWAGRCDACSEWNTLVEEPLEARPNVARTQTNRRIAFVGLEGTAALPPRNKSGIAELDRVLGGGFVPASARLGSTAIAITHDMASATRIGDRAAMLFHGKLVWQGAAAELLHSGNAMVEQFTHGLREGPITMELRR